MTHHDQRGNRVPPQASAKKRRPPLSEAHLFVIRIDLEDSWPPIWRRLEVRSDVNLATLHLIIQGAFAWHDSHLFRFALGDPFAQTGEHFLCDFDALGGDDDGTPVAQVRLDETLQVPGDELKYVYDYGDNWQCKITLDALRAATPQDPIVRCIAGRRAAPPEDCGGLRTGEELVAVLDDPAHFDADETTELIEKWLEAPPGFAPPEAFSGVDAEIAALLLRFPAFREMLMHIFTGSVEGEIYRRLRILAELERTDQQSTSAERDEAPVDLGDALGVARTLLAVVGTGVRLTQAGYLPPSLALEVAQEMNLQGFELSRGGESKMHHVSSFREAMQHAGLLRKLKGDLVPTRAGEQARTDPEVLWAQLAKRMVPAASSKRSFRREASLTALLVAATSEGEFNLTLAAEMMTAAGWRVDRGEVTKHDLVFQGGWPIIVLWYTGPQTERDWFPSKVSAAAVQLSRRALMNTGF